ncbi:hypothetical protein [Azospirillum argentinense]|uniref:Uncharacterized protein n=1 Tax=Azospirillum brasilense TaxID=192 RepID=A0A4D8QAA1_AZOBR|nr:hypothetical protein [Azospirillum argentinense]QCO04900.1 hypothetical protein D3867_23900 [Azospirillum argentinense]
MDVLKAVAEEPLIEDSDGQAIFDPDSFQRRVLAYAETSGKAELALKLGQILGDKSGSFIGIEFNLST